MNDKSKRNNAIPITELEVGQWYIGVGRNSNVGLWDGTTFLVIGLRGQKIGPGRRDWVNHWTMIEEAYFDGESGCFEPLEKIRAAPIN